MVMNKKARDLVVKTTLRHDMPSHDWWSYIKVFRGLALPDSAIDVYKEYKKSKKRFHFNGFTSTTTLKSEAMKFALNGLNDVNNETSTTNKNNNLKPVIFEIFLAAGGYCKKNLNSRDLSAFPN